MKHVDWRKVCWVKGTLLPGGFQAYTILHPHYPALLFSELPKKIFIFLRFFMTLKTVQKWIWLLWRTITGHIPVCWRKQVCLEETQWFLASKTRTYHMQIRISYLHAEPVFGKNLRIGSAVRTDKIRNNTDWWLIRSTGPFKSPIIMFV